MQTYEDHRMKEIKDSMTKQGGVVVETSQNETQARDLLGEKKINEMKLSENNL